MVRNLGPMPKAPRRFFRDFDQHGHHKECPVNQHAEGMIYNPNCECRELDNEDWMCACEAKYDAWKDGDYAREEEG
jgi:hypothetical protein